MVDVVLQGAWVLYRITKDEGNESLPLLIVRRHVVVNAIFLKYSKEGRLSSSNLGIRDIPSYVYYDDIKYYQVQSKYKGIQNTFTHLRGMFLRKQLKTESRSLDTQKHFILFVLCLSLFFIKCCSARPLTTIPFKGLLYLMCFLFFLP